MCVRVCAYVCLCVIGVITRPLLSPPGPGKAASLPGPPVPGPGRSVVAPAV